MAKNKGGRPLKFKKVLDLEKAINKYFKSCWRQKVDMFGNPVFIKDEKGKKTKKKVLEQFKPFTVTGLAVALGTTRETLIDYEAKDKFSDTIKRAKEMCHGYAEEQLFIGRNPTGAIFNLKNNYGWKDKQEVEGNITNNFNDDQIDKIADRIARRKGSNGGTSGEKNTN